MNLSAMEGAGTRNSFYKIFERGSALYSELMDDDTLAQNYEPNFYTMWTTYPPLLNMTNDSTIGD